MRSQIILGPPFAGLSFPYLTSQDGISFEHLGKTITFPFTQNPKIKELNLLSSKQNQINFLKEEISFKHIESQIEQPQIKNRIQDCLEKIHRTICSDLPNAFWNRKKHVVDLPYESTFSETQIPTKSRPIQMTSKLLETCKTEIQELLDKNLIRKSRSPWSCAAFYVNKNAEIERGTPRLVINYKPLNTALRWIRYPIPNKSDLLKRLYSAKIFSKFDMKSGFWQIQISEKDRYKTAFTVPFGQYEWNVMPFGLKNAPSEFQRIMNEIFNDYSQYIIVYIDDVLVYSQSIDQHFKHINSDRKSTRLNSSHSGESRMPSSA